MCQDYHKFLEKDKRWDVTRWTWPSYYSVSYKTGSDTTIGEIIYTNFHLKHYTAQSWGTPICQIREDTIKRMVYRYCNDDAMEYLLYDFSLEENDSVALTNIFDGSEMLLFVDSITTTLINDRPRKTIVFDDEYGSIPYDPIWIEGIGSLWNPLISTFDRVADGGEYLNCVHISDSLIYHKTFDCNNTNTSVKSLERHNMKIHFYRDPYRFELEGFTTEDAVVQIFSINGLLINQYSLKNNTLLYLDNGPYKPGIFLYRFICEEGSFHGRFIMVE